MSKAKRTLNGHVTLGDVTSHDVKPKRGTNDFYRCHLRMMRDYNGDNNEDDNSDDNDNDNNDGNKIPAGTTTTVTTRMTEATTTRQQ